MSVLHGPRVAPSPASSSMLGKLAKGAANSAVGAIGNAAIGELEEVLGVRFDPAPAYLFYVSISGKVVGLFTSCSGLQVTRMVEEIREGGVNDHVHILPGQVMLGRITLSRGISISRVLWDWFNKGLYSGEVDKVNMSIVQGAPGASMLPVGSELGMLKSWSLENAYPVSWSLSTLDVRDVSQVAFENVELACSSISLLPVAGTPLNPMSVF